MSNRDSMGFGDLIPQDVVDIFSHEKHTKKVRKQRSHSLGRALGWLKGKKKKDVGAKGQSPGLGPALDLALDGPHSGHKGGQKSGRQTHLQGNSHAVTKIHDDDKTPAPPLLQENVFIEASRPKYLEDLHSEALEGLKLMQEEETSNGVEFQDNMSSVSNMDVQTDTEGTGFMTDSTIADSSSVISAKSSISTRSSRSGLTRQGSTFRPLNSESEKKKKRRRHRKSVEGIPRHVQRELGLDRVGWTMTPKLDEEQLQNGEVLESLTSGNTAATTLNNDPADGRAAHAGHRDDLALLHHLGPDLSGGPRPRSVAVPSMTTANHLQEPPSPVITTSPQATYMSKIIPNAILPPSIEVVEISRGRSRSSLRTVSKSSLVQQSPAPSRASSRASNRTVSSRESSSYQTSSNIPTDSSGWSNSDSSETLVSDSSTISSSSTPRQRSQDEMDTFPTNPSTSKAVKYSIKGKVVSNGEHANKDGSFARSLSVMKPKRAPPPPSRSYSLHKSKRRSRDLAELRIVPGAPPLQSISASGEENDVPSVTVDSPGYHGDTSSLDEFGGSLSPYEATILGDKLAPRDALKEALQVNTLINTVSPSSGYSSQDGTSPMVTKQLHGSSPKHKKGIFSKLQRLFPGNASPQIKHTESEENDIVVDPESLSPSVRALREIFNIPPHPKIHAPPPPPPEVWVHSRRSVELLLGPPVPDNLPALIKKNPKDRRPLRNLTAEATVKGSAAKTVNGAALVTSTKKVEESVKLNDVQRKKETEKVDSYGDGRVTDEKVRASDVLNEMLAKAAAKRDERLTSGDESRSNAGSKAQLFPPISLIRRSPSPSPPPTHHPPQPPGKQVKDLVASPESSWPPPPPPVAEAVSGQDELDFPLPPPPVISEEKFVAPVAVPVKNTSIPIVITEGVHESQKKEATITALNIPPPPSYSAPLPPVNLVSPALVKKVLLPPVPEVVSQEDVEPKTVTVIAPKEVVSSTPKSSPGESTWDTSKDADICSPPKDPTPEPPKAPSPVEPKEVPPEETLEVISLPLPSQVVAPPLKESPKEMNTSVSLIATVQEVLPTVVVVAAPPPESPPPKVDEVSFVPLVGHTLLPLEETCQESIGLSPPQSIPPPPPLEAVPLQEEQSLPELTDPTCLEQETPSSIESVVLVTVVPSSEETEKTAFETPEVSILPEPEALALVIDTQRETQGGEPSALPVASSTPEETTPAPVEQNPPVVSNSLLEVVKLRAAAEATKVQEDSHTEVSVTSQSSTNEAPQKPIRKSLIILSPTSTSPPAIITTEPPVPKSQSLVVHPPSSTSPPPAAKSPTGVAATPSMNLQEAIRLRTAARSKESPGSRISLNAPTSPMNMRRSPSSTASFIFSKSYLPVSPPAQKHVEAFTKISEAESQKKVVKMPPPVAKKPKAKVQGTETSEEENETEGQTEGGKAADSSEKANGSLSVSVDGT